MIDFPTIEILKMNSLASGASKHKKKRLWNRYFRFSIKLLLNFSLKASSILAKYTVRFLYLAPPLVKSNPSTFNYMVSFWD